MKTLERKVHFVAEGTSIVGCYDSKELAANDTLSKVVQALARYCQVQGTCEGCWGGMVMEVAKLMVIGAVVTFLIFFSLEYK